MIIKKTAADVIVLVVMKVQKGNDHLIDVQDAKKIAQTISEEADVRTVRQTVDAQDGTIAQMINKEVDVKIVQWTVDGQDVMIIAHNMKGNDQSVKRTAHDMERTVQLINKKADEKTAQWIVEDQDVKKNVQDARKTI